MPAPAKIPVIPSSVGSTPTVLEIGDVKIESSPLKFEKAEDILADVVLFVTTVLEHALERAPRALAGMKMTDDVDVMKLIPVLMPSVRVASAKLAEGNMLKRLAPLVCAATQVEMVNPAKGERELYSLVSAKDRGEVFDAHPELYFAVLFHAGRVTFGPFLRVADLFANAKAKVTEDAAATD